MTNTFPGPDDTARIVLPNGIILLSRANFNSPSVVLSGYLPAGALFDPDEKLGLADFTASALMRGNRRRDFQAIYHALESVGASLGFSAQTHTVGFQGRALAEDLPLLLNLLAEALREPVFPESQVERLRAQLLAGLAIRAQDTGDMACCFSTRFFTKIIPTPALPTATRKPSRGLRWTTSARFTARNTDRAAWSSPLWAQSARKRRRSRFRAFSAAGKIRRRSRLPNFRR